jgi:hypothetical protein
MSTLKTHNLQSPDSGTVNIAMAPNAGMVVAGLSTYSNQINVGSNIKLGNAGVITATSFVGNGSGLTGVSGVSVANQADNRLLTATGTTDALNGESNLTFDGNNLAMNGTGVFTLTRNSRTLTLEGNYGNEGHPAIKTSTGHDLRIFTNGNNEKLRITSGGKLTMSSGTVELESHMIRVGNRTTTQLNAGVSTSTGALSLDTTENNLKYYANAQWNTVKRMGNDGSTQSLAARSAKALLDDGYTTNGVYFLDMHGAYSAGNAKRHYCLMDTSYDGGGWTLLYSMNHGNNFASGSNYSFALNVGSNPTTINDFIASNFGYDRRNTFTPAANDQFLIRRSDNNDWRRFVVSTWSPTANSVSNGWTTTNDTTGTNRGHPYYALGQMYDTSGNAVSGMVHFNGCAIGGNCNSGGGDGDGFGDHVNWSSGYSPYSCWGGAFNGQSNGGSPLYWGQNNQLSQGGSLYVQMFYRKSGVQ